MPSIGGWEWIIILLIVVIIFGVGKMSDIGGALGKSIREFREASAPDDEKEAAMPGNSDSGTNEPVTDNDQPISEERT